MAPPPSSVLVAGRATVLERDVLHRQGRVRLVLAVRRGPHQVLVAGVHVQDPPDTTAVQRHEAPAVDDHVRAVVVDLGGGLHRDGHRLGAALEPDDAATGDRRHDPGRGTARRCAVADRPDPGGRCRPPAPQMGPERARPGCPPRRRVRRRPATGARRGRSASGDGCAAWRSCDPSEPAIEGDRPAIRTGGRVPGASGHRPRRSSVARAIASMSSVRP